MKNLRGFGLIELMSTTAIVGILASIALPAYIDYVARAQVGEALAIMSGLKVEVVESEIMDGDFPAEIASDNTIRSTLVQSVALQKYEQCPGKGYIEATMDENTAKDVIAGKTLRLEYLGSGRWYCSQGGSNTIDLNYLPSACRNQVGSFTPTECAAETIEQVASNDDDFDDSDYDSQDSSPNDQSSEDSGDNSDDVAGSDNSDGDNDIASNIDSDEIISDVSDTGSQVADNGADNGGNNGNNSNGKATNNNGHGNNIDGVDSSNPGNSNKVDSDPNVDDERSA